MSRKSLNQCVQKIAGHHIRRHLDTIDQMKAVVAVEETGLGEVATQCWK